MASRRGLPVPSQATAVFDQVTAFNDSVQRQDSPVAPPPDPNMNNEASGSGDKLWTSKDRMKYKKQQAKVRRAKQEQRHLQEQLRSPPLHPNSSDDEDTDDTDDGLGFTLPLNLPVYFSDAEGTTDLTDVDHSQTIHQSGRTLYPFQPPPPPPFEQRGPYPTRPRLDTTHPMYLRATGSKHGTTGASVLSSESVCALRNLWAIQSATNGVTICSCMGCSSIRWSASLRPGSTTVQQTLSASQFR